MTALVDTPRRGAVEPGSGRARADRRRETRLRTVADGVVAAYLLDAARRPTGARGPVERTGRLTRAVPSG